MRPVGYRSLIEFLFLARSARSIALCFWAVGALCIGEQPARAETINWFCDPGSVNVTSADLPIGEQFRFELGVFTSDFVPTSANTSEWASHWVCAQRVSYNAADQLFSGAFTVANNSAPFAVNTKAYIWGFSGDGSMNQWILFRKNTWTWPAPNPLNPFGRTWYAPESNEVVVGSMNRSGSPFLMKTALVANSPLPATNWIQWVEEELSGEAQNGVNDDPDGDGVGNLLEFVFGTSPRIAQTTPMVPVSMTQIDGAAYLQTVFRRRADHPVLLAVEVSDDLSTWQSGALQTEVLEIDPATYIARDRTPLGPEHPRRFMRLRAALP